MSYSNYEEAWAKFEKSRERVRKADRVASILLVVCTLPLVFVIIFGFIQAAQLGAANDACVNSGNLFIKTYDGYECVRGVK
jgi:hypothetical protein